MTGFVMPRLVSATILHRHGSRGPGASELSPFSHENPIYSQWNENDLEVLTSAGRSQIQVLGSWFATRYVLSGLLSADIGQTFWRSSKSDRAFESAFDFVKGFNETIGAEAAGPAPIPYDTDADNYFRPWKVFKKEANAIKDKINTCEIWKKKAQENESFLREVFGRVNCQPNVLENPAKALWSITYLHALREVESFWPSKESIRDELHKALPIETSAAVTSLALWVWEQRFLYSGFVPQMGGRMSVDIIESALNKNFSLNIFSGHDYTILSVLASLNLVQNFERPTGFGAYLLFEVWDVSDNVDNETLLVKIIINPDPFRCGDGHNVDMGTVNESNELLLKEISVPEILVQIANIREEISHFPPPKAIKKQQSADQIDSIDYRTA